MASILNILNLIKNKKHDLKNYIRPIIFAETDRHDKIKTLVDSGARYSCINYETLKRLPRSNIIAPLKRDTRMKLKGAGGKALKIKGRIKLKLKILGKEITQNFYVIEDLVSKIIIGADCIMEKEIIIRGSRDKVLVYFDDQETIEAIQEEEEGAKIIIRAAETKIIQAGRAQRIKASAHIGEDQMVYQGTVITKDDQEIDTVEIITEFDQQGKGEMMIINNNPWNITIERRSVIATAERLRENEIHEFPITQENKITEEIEEIQKFIYGDAKHKRRKKTREEERWKQIEDQIDLEHLEEEEKPKYKKLFREFSDIFSTNKFDLGRVDIMKHQIRLKDETPIHSKQFKIPLEHEKIIEDYCDGLMKAGVLK